MKNVVSIAAFRDGKLLFGLRGDTGKWNMPGGHMESKDGNPFTTGTQEAARRELMEETGLEATHLQPLGWCEVREGLRVYSFICEVDGKADASSDPDEEMVAFKWLDPKKLPKSVMENLHNKKDVTLQFLGLQESTLDLIWDEDAPSRRELESALGKLAKMAIKDLKPGKKLPTDKTLWPEDRYPTYDYSHLLPPQTRKAGYSVILHQPKDPSEYERAMPHVVVHHKGAGEGEYVGEVSTKEWQGEPHTMAIDDAHIAEEHQGKGIGTAAYEALMVHGLKRGYKTIAGGLHSTSASAVHQKLAAKHGLAYKQAPNPFGGLDRRLGAKATGEYDQQHGPYRYTIKSEESLQKMGAMARLAPFNPLKDRLEPEDESLVHRWQGPNREQEDRGIIPPMDPNVRLRALHRIAGRTFVRTNHKGEREYLLHRGMGPSELRDSAMGDGTVDHDAPSSWTPDWLTAKSFAVDYAGHSDAPHHTVSAWVPESSISSVPQMYGKLDGNAHLKDEEDTSEPLIGPNGYRNEHEVIVDPGHKSQLAQQHEIQAKIKPMTTLHGRINRAGRDEANYGGHMEPQARVEFLRDRLKSAPGWKRRMEEEYGKLKAPNGPELLGKFEQESQEWLIKATRPESFKQIAKAVTPEGRRFVDHTSQMNAHPPEHNPVVEHYNNEILTAGRVYSPKKAKISAGISRKVIFQTHHEPQGDMFKPSPHSVDAQFMVKPYHEGIVGRIKSWQKYPVQGWAEMANQALYHAGGIGHLHQKVHVSEHDMGAGHENEPALVVHMEKGMMPAFQMGSIQQNPDGQPHHDALKIGMMDFLTNNLDRHGGNLLTETQEPEPVDPQDPNAPSAEEYVKRGMHLPSVKRIMAIDHSRSFQYVNNHVHKWDSRAAIKKVRNLEDTMRPYLFGRTTGLSSITNRPQSHEDKYAFLESHAKPLFDWWEKASPKIREAFEQQVQHIKDPEARAHIARNFRERAEFLDERARLGIDNYGADWYDDPVVQYHPDQKSDDELNQERDREARAQFEREEAERKAKETQP